MVGVVELALDRCEARAIGEIRYEIDAGVAAIPAIVDRPILEGLYRPVLLPLQRVVGKIGYGEALEIGAFIAFGACDSR